MKSAAINFANAGIASPDRQSQLQLLIALWQRGEYVACLQQAEQIVQAFPREGLAWKLAGVLYGRFGQADKGLQALLSAQKLLPKDAEVPFNLGNAYAKDGRYADAICAYQKAVKLAPKFAQAYENLGSVYHLQNQLDAARKAFAKAIAYQPDLPLAQAELGLILHKQGKPKQAMPHYRKALQLNSQDAISHYNLAQALEDVGDVLAAQASYEAALHLNSEYVDALFNLGYLHKCQKRYDEANAYFIRVLALEPEHAVALQVLADSYLEKGEVHRFVETYLKTVGEGSAFSYEKMNDMVAMLLDKGLPNEAEKYCQMAMAKAPDNPLILNNMGLICYARNDPYAAIAYFEKAVQAKPDFFQAYSNGALPFMRVGKVNEALDYLHKAIALSPEYFAAHVNLGMAYSEQGEIELAISCLERALSLEPDNIKPIQSILFLNGYRNHADQSRYFELLNLFGRLTAATAQPFQYWRIQAEPQRLKIGFVSADLKHHPVGLFLKPLLEHINQAEFDVFVYSNSVVEDHVTGDLKALVSRWQVISHLSDEMAAKRIHEDGIHILIDLSGHTSNNRLPMFAYRPAPLQISWMGYWASTGIQTMDYIIADPVSVPVSAQGQFSEQVAYLPETRLCFSKPVYDVALTPLPALRNGYITLGCYHKYTKATEAVIALWCAVMQALPEAKLRWQTTAFGDAKMIAAAQARFARYGVAAERCQFLPASSIESYLHSYAEVDFILDTFPFTGGTTTCDALWMGVPTLTIAGEQMIARQGASLMTVAGLPDWVVTEPEAFVSQAVLFASQLEHLSELRAQLRTRLQSSALFNGAHFSADFTQLLHALWQKKVQTLGRDALIETKTEAALAPLWVVSATRKNAEAFWQTSALGRSLRRHMQKDARISAHIAFENTLGLPTIYNHAIAEAPEDALLLLVHDDVWLDEYALWQTLDQGLRGYDVIGVAGNRRCLPMQPCWSTTDLEFNEDSPENLLGVVAHGAYAFASIRHYGQRQGRAALIDGVAIAFKKQSVQAAAVEFDTRFDFHFYDLDFSRTCVQADLRLGVWPVALTHQSKGAAGSQSWYEQFQVYLRKWESAEAEVQHPLTAEIQAVIAEVFELAVQAHQTGDLAQAAQLYEEILKIDRHHALTVHNLALILWSQQSPAESRSEALAHFQTAYQLAPAEWQFLTSYVTALVQTGEAAHAEHVLAQAHAHDAQKRAALAKTLDLNWQQIAVAESAAQVSPSQRVPDETEQQALLKLIEAQDYSALVHHLHAMLEIYPKWLDGWKLLSDSLMILKQDASAAAKQALALNPHDAREHCYYGLVLKAQGQFAEAANAFEQAVKYKPDYAAAWNNWGLVLKETGHSALAVRKFEQALQLQPDYAECFSNLLFCLSHMDDISPSALLHRHQQFADKYEAGLQADWPLPTHRKQAQRVLKVGFVSADFRAHSMAHFLLPLLPELAQQPQLQLYAYANQTLHDEITSQMQANFAVWKPVADLSDDALATLIRQDEIDILIDLSGHTSGNRLLTFARKPAPVQISWLGYLHSNGLQAIDYYLTDGVMAPPAMLDAQFTETVYPLSVFACYAPHAKAPAVNALPALKNGYLTFGCFNRPNKITAQTVQLWARVLNRLPDSRLLLGGMGNAASSQHIIGWLVAEGIDVERITRVERGDMADYLQLYHQVDICLDTQPSNGVTTTAHALWMGVPTLCVQGDSLRSRGAMSLMHNAGLAEWIAADAASFADHALALCADPQALARLRAGMRAQLQSSPLMQPAKLAAELTQAWQAMWQHWCAGLPAHTLIQSPTLSRSPSATSLSAASIPALPAQSLSGEPMSDLADPSLQPALADTPEDDPSGIVLAHALELMEHASYDEASQLLRELLQFNPNHAEANYQLGFIETHTIGVHEALPRFEKAISASPMVEQYWVGYIDAMVMANETMVARQAIREGCKYGLSTETAAMLLEELDQARQLRNTSLIAPEHQLKSTRFLIVAPMYTDKSAGIVVLHELCDALNKRGYPSAIHFIGQTGLMVSNQPGYYGPGLKWYQLADYEEAQQFINEGVVIYPEVVTGNPLNAPRVVRYLLNSEGFVAKNSMQATAQDFILAYQESYHPNPHAILTKPCHFNVFNTENSLPVMERKMDMTYIGKGAHHGECYVLPDSVELTRTWPSNRAELAILLKNTRYLYTWDYRTQTVTDAMLCGAIPIFMSLAPLNSYDDLHPEEVPNVLRTTATVENGKVQVHIPDDIEQRLKHVLNGYSESLKVFEANIDNVLLQIVQHFGL